MVGRSVFEEVAYPNATQLESLIALSRIKDNDMLFLGQYPDLSAAAHDFQQAHPTLAGQTFEFPRDLTACPSQETVAEFQEASASICQRLLTSHHAPQRSCSETFAQYKVRFNRGAKSYQRWLNLCRQHIFLLPPFKPIVEHFLHTYRQFPLYRAWYRAKVGDKRVYEVFFSYWQASSDWEEEVSRCYNALALEVNDIENELTKRLGIDLAVEARSAQLLLDVYVETVQQFRYLFLLGHMYRLNQAQKESQQTDFMADGNREKNRPSDTVITTEVKRFIIGLKFFMPRIVRTNSIQPSERNTTGNNSIGVTFDNSRDLIESFLDQQLGQGSGTTASSVEEQANMSVMVNLYAAFMDHFVKTPSFKWLRTFFVPFNVLDLQYRYLAQEITDLQGIETATVLDDEMSSGKRHLDDEVDLLGQDGRCIAKKKSRTDVTLSEATSQITLSSG